uniref:Protein-L-isoaspartate(D-aspartate) O-methyltransferase n=1 Tax=Meloidogyne incognita TaxID=6306 RepID=A0A914LQZ5_MELIC
MGNGALSSSRNSSNRGSQRKLVEHLRRNNFVTKDRAISALLAVDRADFAPTHPYDDTPQYIGYGATISAPHMHAIALEHLVDVMGDASHVLDIGSGSGYLSACFAKLVGPRGKVIGVDHIEELVNTSIVNVRKQNADLLSSGRLHLFVADGRLGWPAAAPYQAIHVGAASEELPRTLVDQLAPGGRMVIPVGAYNQQFLQIDKMPNGDIVRRNLADVKYVPLTAKSLQMNGETASMH